MLTNNLNLLPSKRHLIDKIKGFIDVKEHTGAILPVDMSFSSVQYYANTAIEALPFVEACPSWCLMSDGVPAPICGLERYLVLIRYKQNGKIYFRTSVKDFEVKEIRGKTVKRWTGVDGGAIHHDTDDCKIVAWASLPEAPDFIKEATKNDVVLD